MTGFMGKECESIGKGNEECNTYLWGIRFGTSTLGRKISQELGYKFMDTDDLEKNFNTVHSLMNSVIEEL